MLGFKALIEQVNNNRDTLDTHMGKKLISTVHAKERTEEREANEDMVKHVFRKAVEHVKAHGAKYGKDEHFLVRSKKYDRSIAFHFRPDKYATNDKQSHFVHTTTFPSGEHYANNHTKKIMVEGVGVEFIFVEVE
jgi:hypothetical protein